MQKTIQPLLEWFEQNKRQLPWRQDKDPYHVWVSEIMLQQTRIEAVMGYYARFIGELPNVQALSEVDDDRLLKLWEGLGYYSRARNLKKAALMIQNAYGGHFPQTFAALRKLPGIGDYTAGAIASICFDERVPAVDGNVLRVHARITGSSNNVLLPAVKKSVTAALSAIMPKEAGSFNEALMELGETVCLPAAPHCGDCPLKTVCFAYQNGMTADLPVRVKQQKRRSEKLTVLVLTAPDGSIAIEKRGEGLLSGMYQLPNAAGYHSEKEINDLLTRWRLEPLSVTFLKSAKHAFTHIDWLMEGWQVAVRKPNDRFLWVSRQELQSTYPLPTAFRKIWKP